MAARQTFDKKIYTASLLARDIGFLLVNSPEIIRAAQNPAISLAFVEKIMTVTTAVNGCVYCAWFHAKQAVASGINRPLAAPPLPRTPTPGGVPVIGQCRPTGDLDVY
ncbi:MAG: hypothetical protein Kow0031_41760 [Anaerolineae bacterium]